MTWKYTNITYSRGGIHALSTVDWITISYIQEMLLQLYMHCPCLGKQDTITTAKPCGRSFTRASVVLSWYMNILRKTPGFHRILLHMHNETYNLVLTSLDFRLILNIIFGG